MCILDLSKVLMYEFHYDYIKDKYGKNSRILFIDNKIDAYEDFSKDKKMFDFSNYSTKVKIL